MIIGLTGAHRCGRTTLAEKFAELTEYEFIPANIHEAQKEIGFDSSNQSYGFADRMSIQEHLLKHLEKVYAANSNKKVIVDRTPFDLAIYTLAAAHDKLTAEESERMSAYLMRCIEASNRYLNTVVVVQPGIKIVETEKSPACNDSYLQKLNAMAIGLLNDERSRVAHFYIPRYVLDLDARVNAIKYAIDITERRAGEKLAKRTEKHKNDLNVITFTKQ